MPEEQDGTYTMPCPYGPDLSDFEPLTLETVLTAWLEDAFTLSRYGFEREASLIGRLVADVEEAAEDYLRFVPESAALLGGAKRAFLQRHLAEWLEDGHAKVVGDERHYRALVLPRSAPASIAREAGRQGVRRGRGRSAEA